MWIFDTVKNEAAKGAIVDQATTQDVSRIPRRLAIVPGPLRLIEVRVVDMARIDLTRFPREGGATVGAPHLVAAADLVDPLTAGWAGMRILADHGSAGHRVRVAFVRLVLVVPNNLETVLAGMKLADLALVGCAEIAPTVSIRTGHYELAALWIRAVFALPNPPTPSVVYILLFLQGTLLPLEHEDLVAKFRDGSLLVAAPAHALSGFHRLRNLAHFTVQQELFTMLTVVLRHPGVIQVGDQELLAPGLTAVHAVWILSGSKEVLACACFASGPPTVPLLTADGGFVGAVKGFATDWTGFGHSVLCFWSLVVPVIQINFLEYLLRKRHHEKRTMKRALA